MDEVSSDMLIAILLWNRIAAITEQVSGEGPMLTLTLETGHQIHVVGGEWVIARPPLN